MKVRFLDEWGNKFEISGEIDSSFTIGQGKTVTFAEGATFQGKEIKPNQVLYNKNSTSMTIGLSVKENLVLVVAEPIILKFEESELAELGEMLSEESEAEEEREAESQDEFYTDLKQMLDQYYSTKKNVSVLENELAKIQKKIPPIELLKIKAEEEEEDDLLTLELDEEDDIIFERSVNTVYLMYNNLESRRILLETRKEKLETLLEKTTTEASSEEEIEEIDDELEAEIELEKDEFYTNLRQIFDLYYSVNKRASGLEHDNETLENKLIKMKKKLPPTYAKEEELLTSDFAEEDDTPFDSSADRVYSTYINLKSHLDSLEIRRTQLEEIAAETTFEEEIEDGDEADDEEEMELEEGREIEILQEQYQELQESLDIATEGIRDTGELIRIAKEIRVKEEASLYLSTLETKHKSLQDLLLNLTKKVEALGDLINKKISSTREEYTYEIQGEESEIEDEEFSIQQQAAMRFAAELPLPAEDSDNDSWETIPGPGVLRRTETYFPIETGDFEEDTTAASSISHPPLVRSRGLSPEEWDALLNVIPEVPALDQTFELLSEGTASTREQETTNGHSDSSLLEYEDSDSSLVFNYNSASLSEIEMATIKISGDKEYSGRQDGYWYFTPDSTD